MWRDTADAEIRVLLAGNSEVLMALSLKPRAGQITGVYSTLKFKI